MQKINFLSLISLALFLMCCQDPSSTEEKPITPTIPSLFTLLTPANTHVNFSNSLTEGANTNVLMYEYFYNGGGVAVGDVNNDGLQDIYFSSNMASNRLYLNKGQMQFEDITDQAGVVGRNGPWKTGVTMADVNGDGLLDIYVCYSGNLRSERLINQLYINQGPNQNGVTAFSEMAKEYGLASPAYSTQALFFDYDRDSDLDLLLLNHNPVSVPPVNDVSIGVMLKKDSPTMGVRLYRNDKGLDGVPHFQDVTDKAGFSSSSLTYGLGAGIADIDGDGWQDIYISNDYIAPDYLYINNKNGTFSDKLQNSLGHISHFSMGNDIADINNDGLPDIFTLDMLPGDNRRQKLLFSPDNYEKFDFNLRAGLYFQYMRNMLQINNGNGTFSEIGQLAGISNTDWSWTPLFADFDNDGWKDLFVTNGFLRDFTNQDFIKYMSDYMNKGQGRMQEHDILNLIHKMPSTNVNNYIFKNNGNLTFTNKSLAWGMAIPSNSNGAAYADLDNDGDMDLIVNNINKHTFIYQNEADKQLKHHYLQIKLEGSGQNTQGLGAKVTIYTKGKMQYLEQMPSRGYQSSVSPVLHFGLGEEKSIDSLRIVWLGGRQQIIEDLKADQLIMLKEVDAISTYSDPKPAIPAFRKIKSPLSFSHQDTLVNDFKRQPLLVNPLSFSGPCLIKGDVDGDGMEDIYAGGGSGQAGTLYLQQKNRQFLPQSIPAFEADKSSEDVDAVFLDANGDGLQDLYVCSGGYHNFMPEDSLLQDRLYLNNGKGGFTKASDALPQMLVSKSCVRVTDYNSDGYPDLFVGGKVIPGRYPETPQSYLLLNDGKGRFKDVTASLAPELQKIGMVSDAAWHDLNGDGNQDLILVGEWMPLTVMVHANGKLTNQTKAYFDQEYRGFWNKLLVEDMNGDGKQELVVGNLGLNSQIKANAKEPVEMYYKDFDENGSVDPILCFYIQGKSYPYVTRDELLDQMDIMRRRFPNYTSYADATLQDIFTEEELQGASRLEANYLKTAYFERDAQGKFREKNLPPEVQFSPVFTITTLDYDQDGNKDMLLCGNINNARLRFGKYDANYGVLLKGDGNGHFAYIPQSKSGFKLKGDVRSVLQMENTFLFGINQQDVEAYQLKQAVKIDQVQ